MLTLLLAIRSPGAVAAITAGAAVLGALVGGLISGLATYLVDSRRLRYELARDERVARQQTQRERMAVRGIARTWAVQLARFQNAYEAALRRGEWLSDDMHGLTRATSNIGSAELQPVAAALGPSEWRTIVSAMDAADALNGTRDIAREGAEAHLFGPALDDHDRAVLELTVERVGAAIGLLERLGDTVV